MRSVSSGNCSLRRKSEAIVSHPRRQNRQNQRAMDMESDGVRWAVEEKRGRGTEDWGLGTGGKAAWRPAWKPDASARELWRALRRRCLAYASGFQSGFGRLPVADRNAMFE